MPLTPAADTFDIIFRGVVKLVVTLILPFFMRGPVAGPRALRLGTITVALTEPGIDREKLATMGAVTMERSMAIGFHHPLDESSSASLSILELVRCTDPSS
jgi:hypothetical protein